MKYSFTLILLIFLISVNTYSQKHPIYAIEEKLIQGNKEGLKEIAEYFDSNRQIVESLGWHRIETTESEVAKRIINENCVFTEEEIIIDKNTTKLQYSFFLSKAFEQISFSNLTSAFLITPLEQRKVKTEFRKITDTKQKELLQIKNELFKKLDNIALNQITDEKQELLELIKKGDSKCLLLIASELYKNRNRFNKYNNNKEYFVALLNLLTNIDVGVENSPNTISWHIDKDYDSPSSLNLLIYFANNYKDFNWDKKSGCYVINNIYISNTSNERELFELLNNKNDTIALDAFIQLTNCEPDLVIPIAEEYLSIESDFNHNVLRFPYEFLIQLTKLVKTYKYYNLNYQDNKVNLHLNYLSSPISFKNRRIFENEIIDKYTFDEISSLEYWSLLSKKSTECSYSVGRILDIFYSKHFNEIINNKKLLTLFLIKANLFANLGIAGHCNDYLVKFNNLQSKGYEALSQLELGIDTENKDIYNTINEAKRICKNTIKLYIDTIKTSMANYEYSIYNLKQKINEYKVISEKEKYQDSINILISRISYSQIPELLEFIDSINVKYENEKYSFLEEDFGIFVYGQLNYLSNRKEFLSDYSKYSEFEFYKNMLSKVGINYFLNYNSLDYDKIYDALKYNCGRAFIGDGGVSKDNEVYSIIKLLELTHKTNLGYPNKLCNSRYTFGCRSLYRANSWMQFILENKLLKYEHNEPVSFNYK